MTNKQLDKVSGVVEAVGDKFNGSLKVNGQWYSNKKGFKNPAKKADNVTLSLDPWEFNGKSGLSIVGVEILKPETKAEKAIEQEVVTPASEPSKPLSRDFDAENRGKVRHGLLVPLMPLIATKTMDVEEAKNLVSELTEYVMKG